MPADTAALSSDETEKVLGKMTIGLKQKPKFKTKKKTGNSIPQAEYRRVSQLNAAWESPSIPDPDEILPKNNEFLAIKKPLYGRILAPLVFEDTSRDSDRAMSPANSNRPKTPQNIQVKWLLRAFETNCRCHIWLSLEFLVNPAKFELREFICTCGAYTSANDAQTIETPEKQHKNTKFSKLSQEGPLIALSYDEDNNRGLQRASRQVTNSSRTDIIAPSIASTPYRIRMDTELKLSAHPPVKLKNPQMVEWEHKFGYSVTQKELDEANANIAKQLSLALASSGHAQSLAGLGIQFDTTEAGGGDGMAAPIGFRIVNDDIIASQSQRGRTYMRRPEYLKKGEISNPAGYTFDRRPLSATIKQEGHGHQNGTTRSGITTLQSSNGGKKGKPKLSRYLSPPQSTNRSSKSGDARGGAGGLIRRGEQDEDDKFSSSPDKQAFLTGDYTDAFNLEVDEGKEENLDETGMNAMGEIGGEGLSQKQRARGGRPSSPYIKADPAHSEARQVAAAAASAAGVRFIPDTMLFPGRDKWTTSPVRGTFDDVRHRDEFKRGVKSVYDKKQMAVKQGPSLKDLASKPVSASQDSGFATYKLAGFSAGAKGLGQSEAPGVSRAVIGELVAPAAYRSAKTSDEADFLGFVGLDDPNTAHHQEKLRRRHERFAEQRRRARSGSREGQRSSEDGVGSTGSSYLGGDYLPSTELNVEDTGVGGRGEGGDPLYRIMREEALAKLQLQVHSLAQTPADMAAGRRPVSPSLAGAAVVDFTSLGGVPTSAICNYGFVNGAKGVGRPISATNRPLSGRGDVDVRMMRGLTSSPRIGTEVGFGYVDEKAGTVPEKGMLGSATAVSSFGPTVLNTASRSTALVREGSHTNSDPPRSSGFGPAGNQRVLIRSVDIKALEKFRQPTPEMWIMGRVVYFLLLAYFEVVVNRALHPDEGEVFRMSQSIESFLLSPSAAMEIDEDEEKIMPAADAKRKDKDDDKDTEKQIMDQDGSLAGIVLDQSIEFNTETNVPSTTRRSKFKSKKSKNGSLSPSRSSRSKDDKESRSPSPVSKRVRELASMISSTVDGSSVTGVGGRRLSDTSVGTDLSGTSAMPSATFKQADKYACLDDRDYFSILKAKADPEKLWQKMAEQLRRVGPTNDDLVLEQATAAATGAASSIGVGTYTEIAVKEFSWTHLQDLCSCASEVALIMFNMEHSSGAYDDEEDEDGTASRSSVVRDDISSTQGSKAFSVSGKHYLDSGAGAGLMAVKGLKRRQGTEVNEANELKLFYSLFPRRLLPALRDIVRNQVFHPACVANSSAAAARVCQWARRVVVGIYRAKVQESNLSIPMHINPISTGTVSADQLPSGRGNLLPPLLERSDSKSGSNAYSTTGSGYGGVNVDGSSDSISASVLAMLSARAAAASASASQAHAHSISAVQHPSTQVGSTRSWASQGISQGLDAMPSSSIYSSYSSNTMLTVNSSTSGLYDQDHPSAKYTAVGRIPDIDRLAPTITVVAAVFDVFNTSVPAELQSLENDSDVKAPIHPVLSALYPPQTPAATPRAEELYDDVVGSTMHLTRAFDRLDFVMLPSAVRASTAPVPALALAAFGAVTKRSREDRLQQATVFYEKHIQAITNSPSHRVLVLEDNLSLEIHKHNRTGKDTDILILDGTEVDPSSTIGAAVKHSTLSHSVALLEYSLRRDVRANMVVVGVPSSLHRYATSLHFSSPSALTAMAHSAEVECLDGRFENVNMLKNIIEKRKAPFAVAVAAPLDPQHGRTHINDALNPARMLASIRTIEAKPPSRFVVCVTDSAASRSAFRLTLSLCKPCDIINVVHVTTGGSRSDGTRAKMNHLLAVYSHFGYNLHVETVDPLPPTYVVSDVSSSSSSLSSRTAFKTYHTTVHQQRLYLARSIIRAAELFKPTAVVIGADDADLAYVFDMMQQCTDASPASVTTAAQDSYPIAGGARVVADEGYTAGSPYSHNFAAETVSALGGAARPPLGLPLTNNAATLQRKQQTSTSTDTASHFQHSDFDRALAALAAVCATPSMTPHSRSRSPQQSPLRSTRRSPSPSPSRPSSSSGRGDVMSIAARRASPRSSPSRSMSPSPSSRPPSRSRSQKAASMPAKDESDLSLDLLDELEAEKIATASSEQQQQQRGVEASQPLKRDRLIGGSLVGTEAIIPRFVPHTRSLVEAIVATGLGILFRGPEGDKLTSLKGPWGSVSGGGSSIESLANVDFIVAAAAPQDDSDWVDVVEEEFGV